MKKTTLVKIKRNLSQYQLFSTSWYAYSEDSPVIYIIKGNKRTPCVPAVYVGVCGFAGFPTHSPETHFWDKASGSALFLICR